MPGIPIGMGIGAPIGPIGLPMGGIPPIGDFIPPLGAEGGPPEPGEEA